MYPSCVQLHTYIWIQLQIFNGSLSEPLRELLNSDDGAERLVATGRYEHTTTITTIIITTIITNITMIMTIIITGLVIITILTKLGHCYARDTAG